MLCIEYQLWDRHCFYFFSVYYICSFFIILAHIWYKMNRLHVSANRLQMLFECIKSMKRKRSFYLPCESLYSCGMASILFLVKSSLSQYSRMNPPPSLSSEGNKKNV